MRVTICGFLAAMICAAAAATYAQPVLALSSYHGGTNTDAAGSVAVDACGFVWMSGGTQSADLPRPGGAQPTFGGGPTDAYVARLMPDGTLQFTTWLGGSGGGEETSYAITVDDAGNAYVAGVTSSTDFPVLNPAQPSLGGTRADAFLTKLNPSGQIVYSTYLGGSENEYATAITVTPDGRARIAGYTHSADFPTRNGVQSSYSGNIDAFVAAFGVDGSLEWSTFLGGTRSDWAYGISVDTAGTVYVAGTTYSTDFPLARPSQPAIGGSGDIFMTSISADGASLLFSTYLGGSAMDGATAAAASAPGVVTIAGRTASSDFPVVNAIQGSLAGGTDAFAARFDINRGEVLYATFLGGTGTDQAAGVELLSDDTIAISGGTGSNDFPLEMPIQSLNSGGGDDAFITILDLAGGRIAFSTYLGGSGSDSAEAVAADPFDNLVVVGSSASLDWPTVAAFQPELAGSALDGVVARIDLGRGSVVPGRVGNTLLVVADRPVGKLVFSWADIPIAVSYDLRAASVKGVGFPLLSGSATTGQPGLRLPEPTEPLTLYNIVGVNCETEGPI